MQPDETDQVIAFFRGPFADVLVNQAPALSDFLTDLPPRLEDVRSAYQGALSMSYHCLDRRPSQPAPPAELRTTLDYSLYALAEPSRRAIGMAVKRFLNLTPPNDSLICRDGRPLWDVLESDLGFVLKPEVGGGVSVWVAEADGNAMWLAGTFAADEP